MCDNVCVCVLMCMWQRAPEILYCVQGTHAGSKGAAVRMPQQRAAHWKLEAWKCVSVLEEHRACEAVVSLFGSLHAAQWLNL